MKKTYIIPEALIHEVNATQIICLSTINGVTIDENEIVDEGWVREERYWDEEYAEEYEYADY